MGTYNLVNDVIIGVEDMERSLYKFEGVVNTKNFGCSGVLGDDFNDERSNHKTTSK